MTRSTGPPGDLGEALGQAVLGARRHDDVGLELPRARAIARWSRAAPTTVLAPSSRAPWTAIWPTTPLALPQSPDTDIEALCGLLRPWPNDVQDANAEVDPPVRLPRRAGDQAVLKWSTTTLRPSGS
jgi:hypothetical protein